MDDKVVHVSPLELDEEEKEIEEDIKKNRKDKELKLNLKHIKLNRKDKDDNKDFEKVEELTLPLVSRWIRPSNGEPVHGLEVPVMKDDDLIDEEMYRDDIVYEPTEDDPVLHFFDPKPLPPADVCSICFKNWNFLHHYCCLPCGHVFGYQCIKKWLRTNLYQKCPQCRDLCSNEDVRPLYATPFRIPAANKGVADQEISTRRFPFTEQGIITYKKFEIGRRNFALKRRSDSKKRLAGVLGRKNNLIERRSDLLGKRARLLNRVKALEQRGGSLCQADALRLRADALGKWLDEYLQRAEACEEEAKALSHRARGYNQRVKAYEERLQYFSQNYDNLQKSTTHNCAATATCH